MREAEWSALTRDYVELRRHYDQLVAQNLQAQSAENLERSQKGSKFKIIDSARLPEKPYRPNFFRIMLLAIAGGLGVGLGCLLASSLIDTSFKDVSELEGYLDVPVVCAIPFIEKDAEARRAIIIFRFAVALVVGYGAVLAVVIVYMWRKGLVIV